MKNNKGFTLIELIAAITILSIIMLVAIPNIISMSIKNQNRTYINDANKLVILAKYKFESDANIIKPTDNVCLVLKLDDLDKTELQKGPQNGSYVSSNTYVIVKYGSQKYIYYVQTEEEVEKDSQYRGVKLVEYSEILGSQDKNSLIKESADKDKSSIWKQANSVTGCGSYRNAEGTPTTP